MTYTQRTILIAAITLATGASTLAEGQKTPASQPAPTSQPASQNKNKKVSPRLKHHQDYMEAFTAPTAAESARPEENLQQMIDRLNAMSGSLDHVRRVEKQAKPEPLVQASQPADPMAQQRKKPQTLDTGTMARLRSSLPKNVADPIRLADALQVTGHAEEAFEFYRACLASAEEDHRKSWLLYQMAQCRMSKDPAESITYLRRVIGEHPDSQWAMLAKVQLELLKWTRDDQPRAYLAELETFLIELKKTRPLVEPIEQSTDTPPAGATETAQADTQPKPL